MCGSVNDLARATLSRRGLFAGAGTAAVGASLSGAAGPAGAAPATAPRTARGHRTQLVLLGTSGGPAYWPGSTRAGIASAVVVGDRFYLVDCGSGVVRQARSAGLGNASHDTDGPLDALRGVFLTHLHSDHVVDLNNVLTEGLFNGLHLVDRQVPIWGPGNRGALPPLFGPPPAPPVVAPDGPTPGTREMVELMVRTFATDYNDRALDNRKPVPSQLFAGHDVPIPGHLIADPNGTPCPRMSPVTFFEDDLVRVSATLVQHAPVFPALAFRFETEDGSIVFSGDTGPTDNLVELARDADVLVHEVIDREWVETLLPEPRTPAQEGLFNHLLHAHTEVTDVGAIAEAAGARTLVLSHLVPGSWPEHKWRRARAGYSGELVVGRDLDRIGVGRRTRRQR